jgi:hypothetical protein
MSSEKNNRGQVMPSPKEAVEEKIDSSSPMPDSMKVVPVSVSGIKVVALRDGFYKNARKVEGNEFMVSDMSKVGSWMKCVDAKQEAEHQIMMKARKEEERKAGK